MSKTGLFPWPLNAWIWHAHRADVPRVCKIGLQEQQSNIIVVIVTVKAGVNLDKDYVVKRSWSEQQQKCYAIVSLPESYQLVFPGMAALLSEYPVPHILQSDQLHHYSIKMKYMTPYY